MIVYENNLGIFKKEVEFNEITDLIRNKLKENHIGTTESEHRSWNNSLHFMKDVLNDKVFNDDCKVAIEFNIPQTSKRVDFMLLGSDTNKKDNIVIVELKQWEKVEKLDVCTNHTILADLRSHEPTAHPSYQAWSYKSLIENYCDEVSYKEDKLHPCAYLHNLSEQYRPIIEDKIYFDSLKEAPTFLKNDVLKLRNFVAKYVNFKPNDGKLLYKIDHGKIKPQKSLQDSLNSMFIGNEEFKLIDDQIVAYDLIMKSINDAKKDNKKHVLIIQGGPGTGKSVLAINVLVDCIRKLGLNAAYITKNSAPRNCYTHLLSHGDAKNAIKLKLAIRSPHSLPNIPRNGIDVAIYDEAHRMQSKPYMYRGEDMLYDAINTAKISIFLIDEDQRITVNDCYEVKDIREIAKHFDAVIDLDNFVLKSQFRCNGSDGYIAFINNLLQIHETANKIFDIENYDLKIFDDPNEMRNSLRELASDNKKARMVAGYCYDWNVKNGRGEYDICLKNDFKAKWNLINDNIWAINNDSFEQVGCIHTCQGMEFDYVGVIIGKDLIYKNGKVLTNKNAISKDDRTSGIRKCKDNKKAEWLIKNTYKVLLTRGLKGCYIYCEDEALANYIKSLVH